jgi:hypothetical protein
LTCSAQEAHNEAVADQDTVTPSDARTREVHPGLPRAKPYEARSVTPVDITDTYASALYPSYVYSAHMEAHAKADHTNVPTRTPTTQRTPRKAQLRVLPTKSPSWYNWQGSQQPRSTGKPNPRFTSNLVQLAAMVASISAIGGTESIPLLAAAAAAPAVYNTAKKATTSMLKTKLFRQGVLRLPPAPPGKCYRSIIVDPGATVTCQQNDSNSFDITSSDVSLTTAVDGLPTLVGQEGLSAVVALDEYGDTQVIRMGRTLIDPKLKNLLSASAMFHAGDEVFSIQFSREDSHFLLRN